MGLSWSKRQQNPSSLPQPQPQPRPLHPPSPPPSSSSVPPPPVTPPPQPQQQPSYAFAANAPYSTPSQNTYPVHPSPSPITPTPPPPPPPPPHILQPAPSPYYNSNYSYSYNYCNYGQRPVAHQPNYHPYFAHQSNGWAGFRPPMLAPSPPVPPVPYVDHQSAKKIKNDVNVHKDTIKLEIDESNKDCHLVSFTFDALVDGSITIFYFAKEGPDCTFTPIYPEVKPLKIPFEKGLGQKFCQPSGSGMDLGFFDSDDLSQTFQGHDVFPLVILAETSSPSTPMDEQSSTQAQDTSRRAQITQAVLEKNNDDRFIGKVIKQILCVDGDRYELHEIYGIGNADDTPTSDVDSGKECVICMTEPKDTAILPCRHMCLCGECAKELRLQSNKCPICRQPMEELIEIKVNEGKH